MGMITLGALQEILGWCTILNFGMLIFASVLLSLMRSKIMAIHSEMYALDEKDLSRAYFQYLAQYKIAIFVFNLMPYLALRLMG